MVCAKSTACSAHDGGCERNCISLSDYDCNWFENVNSIALQNSRTCVFCSSRTGSHLNIDPDVFEGRPIVGATCRIKTQDMYMKVHVDLAWLGKNNVCPVETLFLECGALCIGYDFLNSYFYINVFMTYRHVGAIRSSQSTVNRGGTTFLKNTEINQHGYRICLAGNSVTPIVT